MNRLPPFLSDEQPQAAFDPELLRQVMRHWTTGVTVVTSAVDGMIHGMTVNSFTSISLDPPVVHVSLANATRTHAMVKRSGIFGITLLGEDQKDIADTFAGRTTDDADRFLGLETFSLVTGSPLIKGGLASLDCRVRGSLEVGSTTVFFGDVVASKEQNNHWPLVYFNRLYRGLQK
jgi:flavin reductase (DIM6/NTAB) family NADH-FMN oxidoreductase RutF